MGTRRSIIHAVGIRPISVFGVATDDSAHPMWPDIKFAADQLLAANCRAEIFADLNRGTSLGRKLHIFLH